MRRKEATPTSWYNASRTVRKELLPLDSGETVLVGENQVSEQKNQHPLCGLWIGRVSLRIVSGSQRGLAMILSLLQLLIFYSLWVWGH